MNNRTILLAAVATTAALGLAGCAGHAARSHDSGRDVVAPAPGVAADGEVTAQATVLEGTGRAYQVLPASAVVRLTGNAGQSWTSVRLPARPASGNSVALSAGRISAVTVDSHGMALQRSTDNGASWTRTAVPLSEPTDAADLALSADGSRTAVVAVLPGAAGSVSAGELFVQNAGGALVARTAPVAGAVAWVGNRLVLAGGPLHARLYTSDDNGLSWTQRAVGGAAPARFNLDPNTASIGTPLPGPSGAVVLPVTSHGTSSAVRLFTSTDGLHYANSARIPLTSVAGPGVSAVISAAGTGSYLIAEPGSRVLHLVTASGQSSFTPTGLPAPAESLSFSDPQHGLAQVTVRSCTGHKTGCTENVELLRTADGGHSWQQAGS